MTGHANPQPTEAPLLTTEYRRQLIAWFLPGAGLIVSLLYAVVIHWTLNYGEAALLIAVHGLLYPVTYLFVRQQRFAVATHFLTLNFLIQVSTQALFVFPRDGDFYLYLLVGFPLIYMLFDRNQIRDRIWYLGLNGLMLALFLTGVGGEPGFTMSAEELALMAELNAICSITVLAITIFIFGTIMGRAEDEARYQASLDPLTSLNNRRHFYEVATRIHDRSAGQIPRYALVFIDLDHFKQINDKYGHLEGDRVLVAVADVLAKQLRPQDLSARLGGEEFVALLGQTGLKQARGIALRLQQHIEAIRTEKVTKPVHCSIGIACADARDEDLDRVVKRADDAMYVAKQRGRNRIVCSEPDSLLRG